MEGELSGFTDKEIAAELKRRADAMQAPDQRQRAAARSAEPQRMDLICLHCRNPMPSWEATDPENPICDTCMGW